MGCKRVARSAASTICNPSRGSIPWDREQTHQTLRLHLLEETYEVLEALDEENDVALREELGDLLLQIILHTQIAVEDGEFSLAQVLETIIAKIMRRHPHVFADGRDATRQKIAAGVYRRLGTCRMRDCDNLARPRSRECAIHTDPPRATRMGR